MGRGPTNSRGRGAPPAGGLRRLVVHDGQCRVPRNRHRRQGGHGQGHVRAGRLRSRHRVLGEPMGSRRSRARPVLHVEGRRSVHQRHVAAHGAGRPAALRRRWVSRHVVVADGGRDRGRLRGARTGAAAASRSGRLDSLLGDRAGVASGDLCPRSLGTRAGRGFHGVGRRGLVRRGVRQADVVAGLARGGRLRRGRGHADRIVRVRVDVDGFGLCVACVLAAAPDRRCVDDGCHRGDRFRAGLRREPLARGRRARPAAPRGSSLGRGVGRPVVGRCTGQGRAGDLLVALPHARRAGLVGRWHACCSR